MGANAVVCWGAVQYPPMLIVVLSAWEAAKWYVGGPRETHSTVKVPVMPVDSLLIVRVTGMPLVGLFNSKGTPDEL